MLDVNDFAEDLGSLDMDGTDEWTAVSVQLPQKSSLGQQLACLLLCRGVAKAQVYNVVHNEILRNYYTILHVASKSKHYGLEAWLYRCPNVPLSTVHEALA